MKAETLNHQVTWQHPDMLAMLESISALLWDSTVSRFFELSFNGGSATVGITNIPSSWQQKGYETMKHSIILAPKLNEEVRLVLDHFSNQFEFVTE
jgi:hypothetical protein